MKAIITGLHELAGYNQQLLGLAILKTMHANGFNVDGVFVEFQPDEGEPIIPPAIFRPQPGDN